MYCSIYKCVGVSEQAMGWLPLGLGWAADEPSEFSCNLHGTYYLSRNKLGYAPGSYSHYLQLFLRQ